MIGAIDVVKEERFTHGHCHVDAKTVNVAFRRFHVRYQLTIFEKVWHVEGALTIERQVVLVDCRAKNATSLENGSAKIGLIDAERGLLKSQFVFGKKHLEFARRIVVRGRSDE